MAALVFQSPTSLRGIYTGFTVTEREPRLDTGGTLINTQKVLFYIAVTTLSVRATGTHHVLKPSISLTEGQNLQSEIRFIAMEPDDVVDYRIRF